MIEWICWGCSGLHCGHTKLPQHIHWEGNDNVTAEEFFGWGCLLWRMEICEPPLIGIYSYTSWPTSLLLTVLVTILTPSEVCIPNRSYFWFNKQKWSTFTRNNEQPLFYDTLTVLPPKTAFPVAITLQIGLDFVVKKKHLSQLKGCALIMSLWYKWNVALTDCHLLILL